MKQIKKFAGVLLALMMVLAMSVTAFAQGTSYTITIGNPTVGDTYSAYRIFRVSYTDTDGDGTNDAFSYTVLNTDAWWNDLLLYMGGGETKTEAGTDGSYAGAGITLTPAAGQSGTYVVKVTTDATGEGALNFSAPAFAEFMAAKTDGKTAAAAITSYASGEAALNVTESGAGYYLVTCLNTAHDKTTALAELTSTAPAVTITDKNVPPAFDKKQSDTVPSVYTDDALDVQIGDTVNYRITSAVPDLTGYTQYSFAVSDTLSEGLTLQTTTAGVPVVTVKVGGTQVTDWTLSAVMGSYDATGNAVKDENGTETVGFKVETDLVGKQYTQGAEIEITYSAVVNGKAVSGVETNTATLTYSNDPNDTTSTDTEQDETKVYDASIAVLKYDGATSDDGTTPKTEGGNVKYLSGAEFTLYRWALQDATDSTLSFADGSGNAVTAGTANAVKAYYRYTAPTADADATVEWVTALENATHLTTREDGTLAWKDETGNVILSCFAGLEDGTYYLLETASPTGYNLLETPVEVVIAKTEDAATGDITVGSQTKPVANNAGTLLPTTGGIGTTVFYVLGGVLVLGAVILLITRLRMRAKRES